MLNRQQRRWIQAEWGALVEKAQFAVVTAAHPMLLLEPRRVIAEEGIAGTVAILSRSISHRGVLGRLVEIWRTFHRYRDHLGAITLTATRE